jgi:hypothetical protein
MTESIHEGGCLCGALRYRIKGDGLMLNACHCTECQRTSGSAFGLSLIVMREALELTAGSPKRYDRKYEDGRHKVFNFCGECSGRLWNEMPRFPQIYNVKPGTLDDANKWLDPAAHIWLSEKQPWVPIPDDVLRFDEQPEDFVPSLKAYADRLARRAAT